MNVRPRIWSSTPPTMPSYLNSIRARRVLRRMSARNRAPHDTTLKFLEQFILLPHLVWLRYADIQRIPQDTRR